MHNLIVVGYGGGVNSTAMLIECYRRGVKVDLISFADTGGERPETYSYVIGFSMWLVSVGYPPITIVRKNRRDGSIETLEDECIRRNSLPSLAYGFKTCSQKFKIQPQDKFCNNWPKSKDHWEAGGKVTKFIGFDADESHRIKPYSDKKYDVEYPLVKWDMGREECVESVVNACLPVPPKSACFFCPSSKPAEVRRLAATHPELADRAVKMEKNADLTKIKGLGRSYAWSNLIATTDMFHEEYLNTIDNCGCYDG